MLVCLVLCAVLWPSVWSGSGDTKMEGSIKSVVIIGGGFAGLAVARALGESSVAVTLIDRCNHHVFQPLLYQVATASLSPGDISAPIRSILRDQKNCQVVLGKVSDIDVSKKQVAFTHGVLSYDYLVLATGVTHSYFGNDGWTQFAPGLKTVEDALELRRRILLAFESAELNSNSSARSKALTFAIVGAGPTGVELAGAIKEIAGNTIPNDYRNIDTRTTRVILFEGSDRVLPTFSTELSQRAKRDLEEMGVEVRLESIVTEIDDSGVLVGDERILARNVFWAAGVKAPSISQCLGVPLDGVGRVLVRDDLTIPDHPEVFIVGDLAAIRMAGSEEFVPGVAQAAIQMGRYAGEAIAQEIEKGEERREQVPFVYHDKGSMAVIGKSKAVVQLGRWKFGGFIAWLLWAVVHIFFLIGFKNRLIVTINWFWSWLLNARDVRLIVGDAAAEVGTKREASSEDN